MLDERPEGKESNIWSMPISIHGDVYVGFHVPAKPREKEGFETIGVDRIRFIPGEPFSIKCNEPRKQENAHKAYENNHQAAHAKNPCCFSAGGFQLLHVLSCHVFAFRFSGMRLIQQKGHPLRVPLRTRFPARCECGAGEVLLVKQLAQRSLKIARSTSLLCALVLWRVVGHGLNAEAARSSKAVEYNRSARHHA